MQRTMMHLTFRLMIFMSSGLLLPGTDTGSTCEPVHRVPVQSSCTLRRPATEPCRGSDTNPDTLLQVHRGTPEVDGLTPPGIMYDRIDIQFPFDPCRGELFIDSIVPQYGLRGLC